MTDKKMIKGSELEIGMTVSRWDQGKYPGQVMVIYEQGPYYKNPLYKDEVFEVLSESRD